MQSPSSPTQSLDEDRPCNVCFSKLAEPGNEMIFCDGCDVCVHQSCYGVVNIPDGDWFCDRCAAHIKDEPCVLCPVYEGAMKRTEEGNWCHCSCVWWIPEVHFKDPIAMRPVMGVPAVPKERFRLKCIFCDTKNGACIQCAHKNCSAAFHVTCAFATKESPDGATFLMYELSDQPEECGDLIRKAFCPKHRQQQAVIRAQVKQNITSGKMDNLPSAAVGKQSSARVPQDRSPQDKSKSLPPKVHSPLTKKPSPKVHTPLTKGSPRKPSPVTTVDSKPSNAASNVASSVPTKHIRRDTPSVYARPAVLVKAEVEHDSHKKARSTVSDEASAEVAPRILKEFRHASVDTQDHPCSSLLPPLMRLTSESNTNSLFHASSLNRGSIYSSVEGAFD